MGPCFPGCDCDSSTWQGKVKGKGGRFVYMHLQDSIEPLKKKEQGSGLNI